MNTAPGVDIREIVPAIDDHERWIADVASQLLGGNQGGIHRRIRKAGVHLDAA
jgi:hypothetical protein